MEVDDVQGTFTTQTILQFHGFMKVSGPAISIAVTWLCFSFQKSLGDSWDVHSLNSRAFAIMAGKPAGRDLMQYFSGQPAVGFVVVWDFFLQGVEGYFFGFCFFVCGSGAVKSYFTADVIIVGE